MAHSGQAVHRTVLVVDVEGFGDRRRNNPNRLTVREGMYSSLRRAFDSAGIPWERCSREDRGDGALILVDSEVPKAPFVEALPYALVSELQRHNSRHPAEEWIRLRMALHAGEVSYDKYGEAAESINLAFRLVDAPELKADLAASPGVLALIVSSWFFNEVVRHSTIINPSTYRETVAEVKETIEPAWICLPDALVPPERAGPPVPEQRKAPHSDNVPQQLPTQPRSFVGRTPELTELTKLLSRAGSARNDPMPIIAITGMGGIGKTWLTVYWAREHLERFPDGQLYVNLRGFDPSGPPMAPADALRLFLDALGVEPGSLPASADALTALYRGLVKNRRMLIVLDNARDGDQVLSLLPGSPTCTVLITSRSHLKGLVTTSEAHPVALHPLDDSDAHALLAKRLGNDRLDAEPIAADDLVSYCAGLPLALGIVAAHAATREGFPLSGLASDLEAESGRLDALDGGDLAVNLRAILSCSYRALDREVADVFQLLGLVPGPDVYLPAAAALTDLTADRTAALLWQLENVHLVQRCSATHYRMHDLVRLYAAECANADCSPDRRQHAKKRWIAFYVHATYVGERKLYPHRKPVDIGEPPADYVMPSFADDAAVLRWFDVERACLLAAQAAAEQHGWHELVWQLAWTLHGYLWRRGHLYEQQTTWRAGLTAAKKLGDPAIEGVAHRLLGQAHARAGKCHTASRHMYLALSLAKATGDTHGEARVHYDLTLVLRQSDDSGALQHAATALELFQTLDSPVWEAEALSTMGWHQARLGEYGAARASCRHALRLFRQENNRQGQAVTLDHLGYIALYRREYDDALSCFNDSLALCRDLGATYYEADTLDHLGQAHAALGRRPEARRAWQQALQLNRAQHRTGDVHRIEQQLAELG